MLLGKICSKDTKSENFTLIKLKIAVKENLEKIETNQLIELLEQRHPAYQSMIFIIERVLQNSQNFAHRVNTKLIKYVDDSNEIVMTNNVQFQNIVMKEIHDFCLPLIKKMTNMHSEYLEQNYVDFDTSNSLFVKDNNRVENTLGFTDFKIQQKIHKDFLNQLRLP
jgi:hypothetical protein